MWIPLLLLGGVALTVWVIAGSDKEVPNNPPDVPLPVAPGSTGWRGVDALLPELRKAAASAGVPLGLLVGWVGEESAGRIAKHPQPGPGDTKYDERGYFQLMPDESKSIGFDHQRLSTDSGYSINAGLAIIARYMGELDRMGSGIPKGSPFYWRVVKLLHSMGSGDAKKLISSAVGAGKVGSWPDFESYALSGAAKTKHSPAKWFPFVDKVYRSGEPFGFGDVSIVGAASFPDIPDPLECLARGDF